MMSLYDEVGKAENLGYQPSVVGLDEMKENTGI
jgi:hypothetical protein